MKITKGPNLNFYVVAAIFFLLSLQSNNWWIFGGFIAVMALMIPLSLWIAKNTPKWDKEHAELMLREFPHDLEVQATFNPEFRKKYPEMAKMYENKRGI